jgi:small-conductance mechanosensitive channel
MGWLERLAAWAQGHVGISPETITRLVATVLVVLAYVVARRVATRVVAKTVNDPSSRYQFGKATGYLFGFVAVAVLAKIWIQGITGMATYLGLLSAGVAVALQDPLINFAGWIFIIIRRPFSVGDRIQIGPHSGDVIDVRLFQFVLLEIGNWVKGDQSTGRVIYVPNGWVFKNPQANFDKAFHYIWNEIAVVVTFESDWRKAKDVLTRTVTDHSEHLTADAARRIADAADRYHIKFSKLTPIVWTDVVDHGVRLTMRYLCKPRDRRASEHEIWEAVLDEIGKLPDVDFAYPTMRRFDHRLEAKTVTQGKDDDVPVAAVSDVKR